jgi:hypothetical protein
MAVAAVRVAIPTIVDGKYAPIFAEYGVSDPHAQAALARFVETGELAADFADQLNSNKPYQKFVEKAFAVEFAPLQKLVGSNSQPLSKAE